MGTGGAFARGYPLFLVNHKVKSRLWLLKRNPLLQDYYLDNHNFRNLSSVIITFFLLSTTRKEIKITVGIQCLLMGSSRGREEVATIPELDTGYSRVVAPKPRHAIAFKFTRSGMQ